MPFYHRPCLIRSMSSRNLHPTLQYGIELDPQLESLIGTHSKKPLNKFVNADNQHLVSPEAIDLLVRLRGRAGIRVQMT